MHVQTDMIPELVKNRLDFTKEAPRSRMLSIARPALGKSTNEQLIIEDDDPLAGIQRDMEKEMANIRSTIV